MPPNWTEHCTAIQTFSLAKLLHLMLIVSMVRISLGKKVEFCIIDLILTNPLLKARAISSYKARGLVNNIYTGLRSNEAGVK